MSADPAFDDLRARLEEAEASARRLVREATETALGSRPPDAGWQAAGTAGRPRTGGEAAALVELVGALRDVVPAELWERLVALVREMLLVLRALLDLAVRRLEERRPEPVEVEEIPIA